MTGTTDRSVKGPRVVRIERETALRNQLFVNWELGNTCNYACSYCPKDLHDGSLYWPEHDPIIRFVDRLVRLAGPAGKSVHITFTGGEVTLMPRIRSLLQELRQLGCGLGVVSNGSRTLRWWKETSQYLDAVNLTFHPESADIQHFENVVQLLSSRIPTLVFVAALPTMFAHTVNVMERLSQSCPDATVIFKPLYIDFGDRLYSYTAEQLRILSRHEFNSTSTRPVFNPQLVITYDDGTVVSKPPTMLIVEGLNNWLGWECNVGLEVLSITMSGKIYRGLCCEGGLLGHLSEPGMFELPHASVICTRESCTCLLDIMASRRRLLTGAVASAGA